MKLGSRLFFVVVGIYLLLMFGPLAGFDIFRIIPEIIAKPSTLLQQLLIGLANGSIIAVIALGYTLVYGIIELVNFAHGDVFMLGTLTSLTIIGTLGANENSPVGQKIIAALAAFGGAVVFCALVNFSIE